MPSVSRSNRRQPWLVLTLVLSLLFTQWLGFGHAIAHGNGLPELGLAKVKTGGFPFHQKSSAHCAAFDAAALGTGMPMADIVIAPSMLAQGAVVLPLPAGCHRIFIAHFSSRAPPLNA